MAAIFYISKTPLFSAADAPPVPTKPRVETLDGLRGFLALSVFFHHGAIYHGLISTGAWDVPPSQFYTVLGQASVSIFFMLTGFLFWGQLIKANGKPDILSLYVGRVFRIGPLYIFAVLLMLIFVFASTGFRIQVQPITLLKQVLKWASLGILRGGGVNGLDQAGVYLAYVTWSLQLEWMFYISLLVLRFFCRRDLIHLMFPIMLFVLTLPILYLSGRHGPYSRTIAALALFAIGMATASLRALSPPTTTEGALQSTLALSLFSIVVLYCSTSYEPLAVCLLAASFYLVANGATLFGLLTSRSARRLGDVSFGVYLLQGVVLAAAFGWPPVRRLAELHPGVHWLVVFLAAVVLIALATLTHVYVERQGVAWGRALLRRMRRRIAVEAEVAIQKAV